EYLKVPSCPGRIRYRRACFEFCNWPRVVVTHFDGSVSKQLPRSFVKRALLRGGQRTLEKEDMPTSRVAILVFSCLDRVPVENYHIRTSGEVLHVDARRRGGHDCTDRRPPEHPGGNQVLVTTNDSCRISFNGDRYGR